MQLYNQTTDRDVNLKVGERLRRLRGFKGLNQKELSNILNVTPQQVQKYERGKNKLPLDRLFQISLKFCIDVSYFFSPDAEAYSILARSESPDTLTTSVSEEIIQLSFDTKEEEHQEDIILIVESLKKIKDGKIRKSILSFVSSIAEK